MRLLPELSPYIPVAPTEHQWALLLFAREHEVLYGGAAGGAKSWGLLMDQLQWCTHPGYRGIMFRRTYPELAQAEGLLDTAQQWLGDTDAKGSDTMDGFPTKWTFPSGATLEFGHMKDEKDRFKYRGGAWHRASFDELATFTERQFRYIFSRLRRAKGDTIPIAMRGGTNPPETSDGAWVQPRFEIPNEKISHAFRSTTGRVFLPSKLSDNPHLDADQYIRSMDELDPITRQRLLEGDWSVREGGDLFQREWFTIVDEWPAQSADSVRYWDFAATQPKPGTDPDYTVGTRVDRTADGFYYVGDVQRFRGSPQEVEARVMQQAQVDGKRRRIVFEQEPGSSGKQVADYWIRKLAGYAVKADRVTGSKLERARPFSSQAEAGNVKLVNGAWVSAWLDEAEAFPFGLHDDQVDSASGGFGAVVKPRLTMESLYGSSAEAAA